MKTLLTLAALFAAVLASSPARAQPSLAQQAASWAPDVYQDTDSSSPKADLILPLAFDGDQRMLNNWESLGRFTFKGLLHRGVVYWWGYRTRTHDILGYAFFHPRDWEDRPKKTAIKILTTLGRSPVDVEHENDLEGILLVVPRGRRPSMRVAPLLMLTQAHGHYYQYGPKKLWRDGLDDLDGPIRRGRSHRPAVFVEAKGHGVYGSPKKTRFNRWVGDGVLYARGTPTLVRRPWAKITSYRLQRMAPWWRRWLRVKPGSRDKIFTRRGGKIAFRGDNGVDDAANPPWGWIDKNYPTRVNRMFWSQPAHFVRKVLRPRPAFATRIQKRAF